MSGEARKGLRPSLTSACRRALREAIPSAAARSPADEWSAETKSHVDACPDCRARIHASGSLVNWLTRTARPTMPDALSGRASEVLAGIHEKIVERAESGPLGDWIAAADVAMPEAVAADCVDAVVGDRARLASRLVSGPSAPEAAVWSQVRQSILEEVAGSAGDRASGDRAGAAAEAGVETSGHRSINIRWRVMLAGAAASVAIGFLAISSGGFATGGNSGEQPEFAIVDLGRAPDMDFAVARYGLRH